MEFEGEKLLCGWAGDGFCRQMVEDGGHVGWRDGAVGKVGGGRGAEEAAEFVEGPEAV